MKKCFLIVALILTSFTCSNDVEFSNVAFQGDRNNFTWRADTFSVTIDLDGVVTISGENSAEVVNLILPSLDETTYLVGDGNAAVAEYIDGLGHKFSTENLPDESVSIYPELGEIVVKSITDQRLSGTFRFLAFDEEGLNSVGYTNGIFFNIPITSALIDE